MSQITDAPFPQQPSDQPPRRENVTPTKTPLPARRGNMRRAVLGGMLSLLPGVLMLGLLEVGTGLALTIVPLLVWACLTAALIREFGRGTDRRFGILAIGFVLLESLAIDVAAAEGIFLAQTGQSAEHSFSLQTALTLAPRFWRISHLLAYALAAWIGYRFSFHRLSPHGVSLPVRRNPTVTVVVILAILFLVYMVIVLLGVLNGNREFIADLDLSSQGRMRVWAPDREHVAIVIDAEKPLYRVELYRVGNSKRVHLRERDLPHRSIRCLTFSPDSHILALGCQDRRIRLWDAQFRGEETLVQSDAVDSLVFSPSGEMLAAGLCDGSIALWDVRTCRPERSWPAHASAIRTLAITPDGQTLFSAGICDGVVKSWDLATGQVQNSWGVSMDWITCLALSPDGLMLAVAGGSFDRPGEAVLVELASGAVRRRFTVPVNTIANVAFTRDGRNLVAGTMAPIRLQDWPYCGQIHRWDLDTDEELP
jgi:WD40 repeat protein